jgi:hypothetical protein
VEKLSCRDEAGEDPPEIMDIEREREREREKFRRFFYLVFEHS